MEYFTDNVYEKTRVMYDELKNKILNAQWSDVTSIPKGETPIQRASDEDNPKTSVADESKKLLRQQHQNFTALERSV